MIVNADSADRNVDAQAADPNSILSAYAGAIKLRKNHKVLQSGTMTLANADKKNILVYKRSSDDEEITMFLNFGTRSISVQSHVPESTLLFSTACSRAKGEAVGASIDLAPSKALHSKRSRSTIHCMQLVYLHSVCE